MSCSSGMRFGRRSSRWSGREGPAAHDQLRRGRGEQGGNDESGLSGRFGDERDAGEWSSVAGPEERRDADGGKEARIRCVGDGLDDVPRERALGDERNEEAADAAAGNREPRRREPHEEEGNEQAERGLMSLRPGDGLVARSETERSAEPRVGNEGEGEQRDARARNPNCNRDREVLGVGDCPGPGPGQRAAQETDNEAAEEIAQVERRAAGYLEDPAGAEECDVREVRRARGHECRQQGPAREVLRVGNLEREDDAGERRAEHRRDAGRGARHHEHLRVILAEALQQSALGPRADGRAAEQRGSFVAERAARAQRRRALEELRPEILHAHRAAAFVIRADVRIGRRGIGMTRQSGHEHRDRESQRRDRGRQRHGLPQHPREHAVSRRSCRTRPRCSRSTRRPLRRGRARSADDDAVAGSLLDPSERPAFDGGLAGRITKGAQRTHHRCTLRLREHSRRSARSPCVVAVSPNPRCDARAGQREQ